MAFLVVAQDPVRFRPLMLVAVLEKLTYGLATAVLFHLHRVPGLIFKFGVVDLLLAALFLAAFWAIRLEVDSSRT